MQDRHRPPGGAVGDSRVEYRTPPQVDCKFEDGQNRGLSFPTIPLRFMPAVVHVHKSRNEANRNDGKHKNSGYTPMFFSANWYNIGSLGKYYRQNR
jgi:hypothetical protein